MPEISENLDSAPEETELSRKEPINRGIPLLIKESSDASQFSQRSLNSVASLHSEIAIVNKKRLEHIRSIPEGEDIFGTTPQAISKLVIECPKCGQQLGATRFASHYEKCLNKGSRARANSTTVVSKPLETDTWETPCSTCRATDAPDMMLLCDGCSRVYHLWCLVPRLSEIPEGSWFCRKCATRLVNSDDGEGAWGSIKKRTKMSAQEKVKRGRVATGFDVVDYYCDICNTCILPEESRFRCLTCGEFDVCRACKSKGGFGHRPSHPLVEFRVS